MSKQLILLLGCLLVGLGSTAQSDIPIVVMNSTGKVKYRQPPVKKFQKLQAGTLLFRDGTLKLGKNAAVSLYYSGKRLQLDEKGKHALITIVGENPMKTIGFANTFDEFLMASSGGGKSGEGGGGIGWGKKGLRIVNVSPFGGVVTTPKINFEWASLDNETEFTFKLFDDANKVVHEKTVTGAIYQVDLDKLGLETGREYHWQVTSKGGQNSDRVLFAYVGEEVAKEELEKLRKSEAYVGADPVTRMLMEAVKLQDEEMYYAANETFKMTLSKNPGHDLAKKMYATFLNMHELEPLAEQVLAQ